MEKKAQQPMQDSVYKAHSWVLSITQIITVYTIDNKKLSLKEELNKR